MQASTVSLGNVLRYVFGTFLGNRGRPSHCEGDRVAVNGAAVLFYLGWGVGRTPFLPGRTLPSRQTNLVAAENPPTAELPGNLTYILCQCDALPTVADVANDENPSAGTKMYE
eukprot:9473863-Pyramimonas_sp.AAC.1